MLLNEGEDITAVQSIYRNDVWYIFRKDGVEVKLTVDQQRRRISSFSHRISPAEYAYILKRIKIYDDE